MQEGYVETPELDSFRKKIDADDLSPLWAVFSDLITATPKSACESAVWRYENMRAHLLEAGELITAKQAERRVLILENPGMKGESRISTSLYAGLQLVLPGEVAPAHRHSQSALRFVMEGEGGYTAVDGERATMNVGDFIITPPWNWHDHGNETDNPVIWLDGLNIPMIQLTDTSFAEGYPEDMQPLRSTQGVNDAIYSANMAPVDVNMSQQSAPPVFRYPYERSREALEKLKAQGDWDTAHGLRLQYVNPHTGESALPTIGSTLQLLPKAFKTSPYRSTSGTVFTAVEGSGRSWVDGVEITWGPKDIFVVPSWKTVVHEANEDAVIFAYSDRPMQEKLGLFREERLND